VCLKLESPVKGLDENPAPMPLCWCPETISPFRCEVEGAPASTISPHLSVGTPKHMHLHTIYFIKKKKKKKVA
jgi:hypothetical protein